MNKLENEDFIHLSAFIEEMASVEYYFKEQVVDTDIALFVEKLATETACQLLIGLDENNRVQIGAIPPLYYVETSIMPVFHTIKLNIEKQY